MHLPKLLSSCKTRGAPQACVPGVPGLPKCPLVFHVTRTLSSHAAQDCPMFTLTICIPGPPAVPRETGMVGHPTCHPAIGSGLLGSWFPYLYPPPPKKRSLKDPQAGCIHPTNTSLSPRLHPSLPNFQGHLTPTPTITPRGWEQSALREAPGNPMASTRQDIGFEAGATS